MEEKQERKKYAAKGERSQKMVTFRADIETIQILDGVTNKGRLLNELVQEWKKRESQ